MKLRKQVKVLRSFVTSTMLRVDDLELSDRRLIRAMGKVKDAIKSASDSEQAAEVRIAAVEQGLKDANKALADAKAASDAANAALQAIIDAKTADETVQLADLQTLQGHLDKIDAAVTPDTSAPAPDAGNAGSGDTSGSAASGTSGDTSGAPSDASGSSDGSAPVV